MTRSGRAYPLATGSAVRCFCRNALKNRFHFRPCLLRTAGHDRSSIQGSFFTAGHSATNKEKSFRLRQFDAAVGIFVIGVTTINKNVSRWKQREKLVHQFVNRTSGTNHHHYLTGNSYRIYKCFYICESFDVFTFCTTIHKAIYHSFLYSGNCTVIYRYMPPLTLHV